MNGENQLSIVISVPVISVPGKQLFCFGDPGDALVGLLQKLPSPSHEIAPKPLHWVIHRSGDVQSKHKRHKVGQSPPKTYFPSLRETSDPACTPRLDMLKPLIKHLHAVLSTKQSLCRVSLLSSSGALVSKWIVFFAERHRPMLPLRLGRRPKAATSCGTSRRPRAAPGSSGQRQLLVASFLVAATSPLQRRVIFCDTGPIRKIHWLFSNQKVKSAKIRCNVLWIIFLLELFSVYNQTGSACFGPCDVASFPLDGNMQAWTAGFKFHDMSNLVWHTC